MVRFFLVFLIISSNSIAFAQSVGDRVCHTWKNGKNGWCGYITQEFVNAVRIENYSAFCGSGGFLGICTNIYSSDDSHCMGGYTLFTSDSGEAFKNPPDIVVPKYCLD